ncbi:hypothetical protein UPYG_G00239820 [Umbra pygmaea]|uniref:Uncharacterized protein n=1 Tax=Umbra pygmaea TaxID=75934 RepID=A0ABD0WZ99_UMBPY
MENSLKSSLLISVIVVLNIIVWMVLITALGLGAMHLNDCPLQPYIPIYLVVIGATSIASLLLFYFNNTLDTSYFSLLSSSTIILLQLFNLGWFIAGSVWVYSIHTVNYDATAGEKYCKRAVYLFAFWFNSLGSICVAMVCTCGLYCVLLTFVKMAFRGQHLFHSQNRCYGVDA